MSGHQGARGGSSAGSFVDEPPPIESRTDTGSGFWNIGWPLLALSLIVLMSVHACVK